MGDTLNDRLRAEIVDLNDALWSCREALISLVEACCPDGAPDAILMAMENARRLLDAPGRCAQETARLRAEVERYKTVVETAQRVRPFLMYYIAYDGKPWAGTITGSSAPLGELAEAVDELAALPAAADPATEGGT